MHNKVILITGASSGLGQACASHLAQRGLLVFGTSRRASAAEAEPLTNPFEMIPMDVTRDDSVQQGIRSVLKKAGRLDVVVNNAGFGLAGAVEDTSLTEAKEQFETNFFGALRVCTAVLPVFRGQQGGCIINISSLGGRIGLPYQGLYSASKFALEGLSEALYQELRPLGIRVVVIEPGDFNTPFTANRQVATSSRTNPAYKTCFEQALKVIESDETNGSSPARIAHLVERIIADPDPSLYYTVGALTQRLSPTLKNLLPGRFFEWIIRQHYRAT